MSSDTLKDWPRWALIALALIGLLAVGAIGTWGGASVVALQGKTADHETRIQLLERERDMLREIKANTEALRDSMEDVKRDVAVLKSRNS